eukprot:TRINITY_DN8362_c0_g1_i3.p1 TRINITY_DN8362_c0_g1~~TRINITY_DN8362_c0_g1_i3.p1  ORF type:complete len:350 (-),score=83.90 TRINITY_DN8362_c0_g1_i3:34-1083(-)
MLRSLVGSEMCIRDRYQRRVRGSAVFGMELLGVDILAVSVFTQSIDLNQLANLAATSKALRTAFDDPRLWQHMCNRHHLEADRSLFAEFGPKAIVRCLTATGCTNCQKEPSFVLPLNNTRLCEQCAEQFVDEFTSTPANPNQAAEIKRLYRCSSLFVALGKTKMADTALADALLLSKELMEGQDAGQESAQLCDIFEALADLRKRQADQIVMVDDDKVALCQDGLELSLAALRLSGDDSLDSGMCLLRISYFEACIGAGPTPDAASMNLAVQHAQKAAQIFHSFKEPLQHARSLCACLLYTSDAADEEDSVDLGGRRIIKKKNKYVRSDGIALTTKTYKRSNRRLREMK